VLDGNLQPVLRKTNVGRDHYFQAAPTKANIRDGQVTPLTGRAFDDRVTLLVQGSQQRLDKVKPPRNLGVLIPHA
jgi:hypothetical protein